MTTISQLFLNCDLGQSFCRETVHSCFFFKSICAEINHILFSVRFSTKAQICADAVEHINGFKTP